MCVILESELFTTAWGYCRCYCRGKCWSLCGEGGWTGGLAGSKHGLMSTDKVHHWLAVASGQSPCLCFCALT